MYFPVMLRIPYLSSGESLLHVLIICDSPIHTRIARLLLKNFPKSALDKVEGEEYLGEQVKSAQKSPALTLKIQVQQGCTLQ